MLKAAELKTKRKNLGEKIRTLRRDRCFSQESFAEECGLHRTYIGGVERGERNVSFDNIAKIASALSVQIKDLF